MAILKRFNRSPLAYPAGAVPGVDLNHPASKNMSAGHGLSAVAIPGGMVSLLRGRPCTNAAVNVSSTINGGIGPSITSTGGGAANAITDGGNAVVVDTAITLAGIIYYKAQAGGVNGVIIGTGTTFTNACYLFVNGTSNNLNTYVNGGTISGVVLNPNEAYFVAASNNGTNINFIARSLMSGKVQTATVAATGSLLGFTSSGTYVIQNDTFSDQAVYPIAAVAYSPTFLSPSQLLQWAADPWSFWYPNRTIQYTTPATTTTSGGARIRQRWNRSPLAYPAGAVPGVDPAHPATVNLLLSATPGAGANYIEAATGAPLSVINGSVVPTTGIDGAVGPYLRFTASNSTALGHTLSGTVSNYTIGAIFNFALNTGGDQTIAVSNTFTNGFYISNGVVNFSLGVSIFGASLTVGHSYFVGMSAVLNGAGSPVNIVVKDLTTGRTFVTVTTNSRSPFSLSNVAIGADGGDLSNIPIAAVMQSGTFLSLSQLLAWAADPFSFWYPRRTRAAASAGASFLPVWAYLYNLPVLGTGNF